MKYPRHLNQGIDQLYSVYYIYNDINISLLILEYCLLSNPTFLVVPLPAVPLTKRGHRRSPQFRHAVTLLIAVHFLLETQHLI
jgi:hypothetical protein